MTDWRDEVTRCRATCPKCGEGETPYHASAVECPECGHEFQP